MNPLQLAWIRLRRGGTGMHSVVALIALAGLGMLTVSGIGVQVQRSVMSQALESLHGQDRFVTVSYDGRDSRLGDMRTAALDVLAQLTNSDRVVEYTVYRPMWDGKRSTYQLAATTSVADLVALTDGRYPAECTPSRCEVVQIGLRDVQVTAVNLVIVGHGQWTAEPALARALDPSATVLVGSDAEAAAALPSMTAVAHSWLWGVPLDTAAVVADPQRWLQTASTAVARASVADARLVLAVPDAAVASANMQAGSVRDRLHGLALAIALLSVVATALAAAQNRERILAVRRVVRQYRPDERRAVVLDIAVPVVVGRIAGAALALAACVAGVEWPPLAGWVASGTAALASIAAGWALVSTRRAARWLLVAVSVAWCAVTAWVLHVTPTVAVACLSGGAAGAVAARLALRTTGTPLRRSLTANNRGAVIASVTVVALTCATAAAALTQGAMLDRNAVDHAVFTSPLPVRVTALEHTPVAAMALSDYEALGATAYPVARLSATSHSGMLDAAPVQVMGLPKPVLAAMPDVSHQTGVLTQVVAELGPGATELGLALPAGDVSVKLAGVAPHVDVAVWLVDRDGRLVSSPCEPAAGGQCIAPPAQRTPARLVGMSLTEDPGSRARREHAAGEGAHDVTAPHGTLAVSGLAVGGAELAVPPTLASPFPYDLATGPAYLPVSTAASAPTAVVDPQTAATAVDGVVALRLSPGMVLPVRVVGVADRFPTATPHFAIVELTALTAALATQDPSLLTFADVWLAVDIPDDAASHVRAAGLAVTTRAEALRAVTSDAGRTWTTRGTLLNLVLMLAICALTAWGLAGEIRRRTPAGPWRDIGTPPRAYLTTVLTMSATAVAAASCVAIAVAAPVAGLVERALGIDATGAVALPPLAPVMPVPALAAVALLALCVATTATLMALRGREESV